MLNYFFCSLDILFCYVLVAVAFVICSRCLMSRSYDNIFSPFFFLAQQRVLQFERVSDLPCPKIHKTKSFQAFFIAHSLITTKTRGPTYDLIKDLHEKLEPWDQHIKREYPYLTLPSPLSLKLLTSDPSGRGIKPIRRETRSK